MSAIGFVLLVASVRAQQAYVGGTPEFWDTNAITVALEDLHPELIPDLGAFINAMIDYTDADIVPRDLHQFSAEPVPMINEVIVSNTLKLVSESSQDILEHRVYITIETWFPFATTTSPDYRVEIDENLTFSVLPSFPEFNTSPVSITDPSPASFTATPGSFQTTSIQTLHHAPVNGSGQPVYAPGGTFRLRLQINGDIRILDDQSNVVDAVFGPWETVAFMLSGARPGLAVGGPEVGVSKTSNAVDDPRINWDPHQHAQWQPYVGTPGTTNIISATTTQFMYAAQSPFTSVLDLTNLLFDASNSWTTVRFNTNDPWQSFRIIDRLTVNPTNFGTPYSWLASYGYTNAIDTAEMLVGENGIPLWQSQIAGLAPTDPQSHFLAAMDQPSSVAFNSITDRLYSIYYTGDLIDPNWSHVLTSNIPGTGNSITIIDPSYASNRAYRINVQRP